MGFWRWRGAKRTSNVSGWARRRASRAVHCAKVVLKICVPEPSVNILTWKRSSTASPTLARPRSAGRSCARCVSSGLAAIDVPVSVGKGMLLGAGGDHAQQEFEAVVRLDAAEIGAVRAEL